MGPYCATKQVCAASRLLPAVASATTWTLITRDSLPLQLIMLRCLAPGTIGTVNSHGVSRVTERRRISSKGGFALPTVYYLQWLGTAGR